MRNSLSSLSLGSAAALSHSGTGASVDEPAPLFVPQKAPAPAEFDLEETAGRLRKAEKLVFGIVAKWLITEVSTLQRFWSSWTTESDYNEP